MKKTLRGVLGSVLFLVILFSLAGSISAESLNNEQKNVYFFWGIGCSHCETVKNSGILEEADKMENVKVYSLEVYANQTNRDMYMQFADSFKIGQYQRGVPFLVIECSEGYSYFIGDTPIISNLKDSLITCTPMTEISRRVSSDNPHAQKLTLGSIIIAAIIDSINPCAFGVLIFLLATLISTASSKKALKYGMIYTFIIFVVYFLAGLGIMKIITTFSHIMKYVIFFAGALVFIGGIIEIKDFFWYGKGFSLKIPESAKPLIEKMTKRGTLPAVIVLGVLVALVELPCTGGIYLAVLSLMQVNKTFGIPYLLLYNLIFVTPLIIMVLFAYFGTRTGKIQRWVEEHKRYMRLAAGIIMVALAIYLLNSIYNWI